MAKFPRVRSDRLPIVLIAVGAVLLAGTALGAVTGGPDRPAAPSGAGGVRAGVQGNTDPVYQRIIRAQDRLRSNPDDAMAWARLGTAYVEQARISADPSYYTKAQGALQRSRQLQPEGNFQALIGLAALANARHDFAAGLDFALRARELAPATAQVYAVLADARTQLGDVAGATAAVQQMLNLAPGVASFTRASYELELHGRVDDARRVLQRALDQASTVTNIVYCRYYLGELAFNTGRLDAAARQYRKGLEMSPGDIRLLQGTAKVAAARGNLDRAIDLYQRVTNVRPTPQYIQEYGELLLAAGRTEAAPRQFELFRLQQRLLQAQGSTDHLAVALFLADHGDPAEAVDRARAAWQQRQSVFTANGMAWALHAAGRDAEALRFADKAMALGWRNATFAYHRGMILKALGRDAEARQQLAEALEINPYFSPLYAPKARQALTELRADA